MLKDGERLRTGEKFGMDRADIQTWAHDVLRLMKLDGPDLIASHHE